MKTQKICIVGGGNISNLRHIPAIKHIKSTEITGIIGTSEKAVNFTKEKWGIRNSLIFDGKKNLSDIEWLDEVKLVVIGVPPREHYRMAKLFLNLRKNVLVEKPMVMNSKEAKELIALQKKVNKKLFVMHNFQFANGFIKLINKLNKKDFGKIHSIYECQFTNNTRRLPSWHNDLPLGLFYDEAAHFLYLLDRVAGKVKIINCFAYKNKLPEKNTPEIIQVNMNAGSYPATLYINFNSPICEWLFIISGSKKIAIYDFFRDILITIPNDGLHLAKDVLNNSLICTINHWYGFIKNGFKLMFGKLYWGHDRVISLALNSINKNEYPIEISAQKGLENVELLNEIINSITFVK